MKHEPICHAYRMDYFVFRNPSAERRNPKTPFTITRSYGMSTICHVKTVLARMNRPAHNKRFAKTYLSHTGIIVCPLRIRMFVSFAFALYAFCFCVYHLPSLPVQFQPA